MAVTRAKATALLNKTEMGLYDDSRANALRDHSESRLAQLVPRARTARDRARDLEKRQRLASRKTSGSKSGRTGLANARTGEKVELLADILSRLETRQRDAAKAAKAAAKAKPAKAAASKRAPVKKAAKAVGKSTQAKTANSAAAKTAKTAKTAKATKTAKAGKTARTAQTSKPAKKAAAAKKTAPSTTAAKRTQQVAKKTAKAPKASAAPAKAVRKPAKHAAASKAPAVAKKAPRPAASEAAVKPAGRRAAKVAEVKAPAQKTTRAKGRGKRAITPEQALENTRKLLEQREAEAKSSKPWETLGTESAAADAPGYQSPQARSKALALHEAETRQAPINGSISTRDRRNQGKRDHRNSND